LGRPGIACGWTWTKTWLEHFGDLVPHWFAIAEDGGMVRGLALVTQGVRQKVGPVPVKTVHLGTAGEPIEDGICVEYNRLLVDASDRPAFARGIFAAVRSSGLKWEEFLLDGFVPEDAAPFLEEDASFFVRREPCPTSDLQAIRAAGGDVIASLGKSTRASVRRGLRGFGNAVTEWADTPDQAKDILDELIELHQRRWQEAGKPGAFAGERFRAFHRALIPRLLAEDAAYLFRVTSDLGTIGCLYGFIENGRVLFYQSGFGRFADGKLSPGLVAHALCMQACLDKGLNEYDFLMGDMRYKRELSNIERELVWAVASRPGIKGRLLTLARRRKYGESSAAPIAGSAE
jgi:CelD/BcsL family acetyltransferase involved in cellulose biosynthesis